MGMEHDEGHVDPQASFESVEKWAGKMQITDPDASFANWQRDRHGFVGLIPKSHDMGHMHAPTSGKRCGPRP
jgi:hypothetical protein